MPGGPQSSGEDTRAEAALSSETASPGEATGFSSYRSPSRPFIHQMFPKPFVVAGRGGRGVGIDQTWSQPSGCRMK